jgi:hypothetical protein
MRQPQECPWNAGIRDKLYCTYTSEFQGNTVTKDRPYFYSTSELFGNAVKNPSEETASVIVWDERKKD